MLDRLWNRIKDSLPPKQAAYQPGRGTTEQVHAVKLLAEKAIISSDYNIYLLLLDMSKAFDNFDRTTLFEHLEEILDDDELFIMHILTNKPEISVKIGSKIGKTFATTIGIIRVIVKPPTTDPPTEGTDPPTTDRINNFLTCMR